MKKLILIDGNAIMHRAYHALPPLTTKNGELVNAVYGFTSTLLSVINDFRPHYVITSFDLPGPTFRHVAFKEYKATRKKAPEEFYIQIPKVKEIVKAFSIPIYEKEGFEADDIIGTIVEQTKKEKVELIIVTGDLDALQLVSKNVKVFTMRKGLSDSIVYDKEKVLERYEVGPSQLIDFKGLAGDASDNIPGVKGVGEKTTKNLLKKYKTIEGVYKNINEIKGSVKEKLENNKSQAFLSKQLATIKKDVPIKLNLKEAELNDFDRKEVTNLFNKFNFFSLIKRIPGNKGRENNKKEVQDFKYYLVEKNLEDDFFSDLKKQKEISLAVREEMGSTGGIAFSWKTGRSYFITSSKENLKRLKGVLENEKVKKIGFDLKKDYKELKKKGIVLKGFSFDVMLAAYLLDPGKEINFSKVVFSELGEEIDEKEKSGQLQIDSSSVGKYFQEFCQKADYSLKLKNVLLKKIKSISLDQEKKPQLLKTLDKVMEEIEIPLILILAQMEERGIKLNPLILRGISEKIDLRLKNLEKSIYKIGKGPFNINSPQQLSEVLFVRMGLPIKDIKKTKKGYSTASSELEKIRDKSNIVSKIEEYRELFKLKTTYLDTLPKLVDEKSRIHTNFNQAVTATGRLSSSEPNLQNIPIKTDLGQLLRTAFISDEKNVLISADYSQIDLRAVAHVSEDEKLIEAFLRGDDIHKMTASEINKVPLSQVTGKMRRAAKALNFGVIYGMSVFGLSQAAGIEREEAKKFIDEYMKKFSGVAKYIRETKDFAKSNEYVETLFGRRRNIPEINSPNFQISQAAERMAINMPIQGLAADIMKIAMIKVHKAFEEDSDVKMVLQIHDEIILEVSESKANRIEEKVKDILENVINLKVPLVVDIRTGESLGEI